MLIPPAQV